MEREEREASGQRERGERTRSREGRRAEKTEPKEREEGEKSGTERGKKVQVKTVVIDLIEAVIAWAFEHPLSHTMRRKTC